MVSERKYNYPEARRDSTIVDNYFGVKVHDYYRHFENPKSPETLKFITAQNELTNSILRNSSTIGKVDIEKMDYELRSLKRRYGKRSFYTKKLKDQNQAMICSKPFPKAKEEILVDPNKLDAFGFIAIDQFETDLDGMYLAYSLTKNGSDWRTIHIMDVETKQKFPEVLERVINASVSWTHDKKGFFYASYPIEMKDSDGTETKLQRDQKIYYHRIGDTQEQDDLIVELPKYPLWRLRQRITHCGHYLIITVKKAANDEYLLYIDLDEFSQIQEGFTIHPFTNPNGGCVYKYVTNIDRKFVFRTNRNAPNYRLIQIDLDHVSTKYWIDIIKENREAVLHEVTCVNKDKLLVQYLRNVKAELSLYSLTTGKFITTFANNIIGKISVSSNNNLSEFSYSISSLAHPGRTFRINLREKSSQPKQIFEMKLMNHTESDYKIEQRFYRSVDGTKVPIFILQKLNRPQNQRCPCLLVGYGGFGSSQLPEFNPMGKYFVDEFDGIYALPCLRGGSEYGTKWHDGGRLLNKQNVWDDWQMAAKYLVCKGYTWQRKICIFGQSNGGMGVAACLNQRPYRFGAAIVAVGPHDVLRYPRFTCGSNWIQEYGNARDTKYFQYIYEKYSPLHNIRTPMSKKEEYPGTLIITGDHDNRVCPLHSYKYAAELQHAVQDSPFQRKPILLQIRKNTGHGSGVPLWLTQQHTKDMIAFIQQQLHIKKKEN